MEVLPQRAYIGDASRGPNPINAFFRYFPFLLFAGFMGELASIIVVGRWLGVLLTLALVIVGILLGLRIVRSAGLSLAEAFRQSTLDRSSVNALDRTLVAGAGLLFILPGFLSDLVALFLLVPSTRRWIGRSIASRVKEFTPPRRGYGRGRVIEGEVVEVEDESRQDRGQFPVNPPNRE